MSRKLKNTKVIPIIRDGGIYSICYLRKGDAKTMAGISSIASTLPSVETLVNQYLAVEKKPIEKYEPEKAELNTALAVLTDLKSELTNLNDRFESFTTASTTNTLAAKTAVSSDESLFTVDADSTAVSGVYSIRISQLAKNDTAVSDRFAADSSNLASQFKNRSLSFRIGTGSEKPTTFSIDINDSELTNEELLQTIAREINSAGIDVSATVIKDTPTSVRLTLIGKNAGSTNALQLDDFGSAKVFQTLGFIKSNNDRPAMFNSHGGFVTPDTDDLNAQFSINGIEIIGSSNTVTDVLQGVTVTLRKAQESGAAPESITISGSADDVLDQVEQFIEEYNSVVEFITAKSAINTTTLERGALAGNYTVRSLLIDLRSLISGSVSSVKTDNPKTLREIGIDIKNNGTLEISDRDTLTSLIEEGNEKVTDIFNSSNGLAVRGQDLLQNFISTGGTIDDISRGKQSRITGINTNVKRLESRLSYKENSLRQKFSGLQRSLSKLNSQNSLLQQISSSISQSGYYTSYQNNIY